MRGPLCGGLRAVESLLDPASMVAPDDLEMGFVYRYASSAKAERVFGWKPAYAFEDTVADQARDLEHRGLL
jgi:hypothetical protein